MDRADCVGCVARAGCEDCIETLLAQGVPSLQDVQAMLVETDTSEILAVLAALEREG